MLRRTALLIVLGLLVAPLRLGAAEISVSEQYPLKGAATTLTLTGDDGAPVGGATVVVLYRPNSQTSFEEVLPATGADGTLSWTPTEAGIVSLTAYAQPPAQAPDAEALAERDVAVRFGGFPPSGLFIMLLAGLLLFGGAGFGFSKLLKD